MRRAGDLRAIDRDKRLSQLVVPAAPLLIPDSEQCKLYRVRDNGDIQQEHTIMSSWPELVITCACVKDISSAGRGLQKWFQSSRIPTILKGSDRMTWRMLSSWWYSCGCDDDGC